MRRDNAALVLRKHLGQMPAIGTVEGAKVGFSMLLNDCIMVMADPPGIGPIDTSDEHRA